MHHYKWEESPPLTKSKIVSFYSVKNGILEMRPAVAIDLIKLFQDKLSFEEIVFSRLFSMNFAILNKVPARQSVVMSLPNTKIRVTIRYNNYDREEFTLTEHELCLGHFTLHKGWGLNGVKPPLKLKRDVLGSPLLLDTLHSIHEIDDLISEKMQVQHSLKMASRKRKNHTVFTIINNRHIAKHNNDMIRLLLKFKSQLTRCSLVLENMNCCDQEDETEFKIFQAEVSITLKKPNSSAMHN